MPTNHNLLACILLLLLFLTPCSPFKAKKLGFSSGRSSMRRSSMSIHAYRSVRQSMIYLWGTEQFEKLAVSVYKHVSCYGYIYLAGYNFVYLLIFAK